MKVLFAPRGRWGKRPAIADHIDASGDCWEWTGGTNSTGYGQYRTGEKAWLVHRLVWETLVGPIPVNLQLDHLCRNTICCNPDHLEVVTNAENSRRGMGNQNVRKTHCIHGHPLTGANLYRRPNGGRDCRTCVAKRTRKWNRKAQ